MKLVVNKDKTKIEVTPLSIKDAMRDLIKINLKDKDNKIKTFAVYALVK